MRLQGDVVDAVRAWQAVKRQLEGELVEREQSLSSMLGGKEALEQAARDAQQENLRLQLEKQSMQHQQQLEQVGCIDDEMK